MELCHLFISTGHNFVGHHGREPDTHLMIETAEIECMAGRGIRGDRYFDFKDDYKGQIIFFRWKFSMNFAARCTSSGARLLWHDAT